MARFEVVYHAAMPAWDDPLDERQLTWQPTIGLKVDGQYGSYLTLDPLHSTADALVALAHLATALALNLESHRLVEGVPPEVDHANR
jgi:hypothetical protein